MLKQSSSRIKKLLAILLAILFLVSLTSVATSAAENRNGVHIGAVCTCGHCGGSMNGAETPATMAKM